MTTTTKRYLALAGLTVASVTGTACYVPPVSVPPVSSTPTVQHVTQEQGDALAEGDAPGATTRDWEACTYTGTFGDGTVLHCTDITWTV